MQQTPQKVLVVRGAHKSEVMVLEYTVTRSVYWLFQVDCL